MFGVAPGVRVYLAVGVTDMRKSIDRLSVLVESQLDLNPLSGHLFVFCNQRRSILKILYWDRNGYCLWQKRLEHETFRWPERESDVLEVGTRELRWLLDGLPIEQSKAHREYIYSSML